MRLLFAKVVLIFSLAISFALSDHSFGQTKSGHLKADLPKPNKIAVDLRTLFEQLDEAGRSGIKDAKFVELTFAYPEQPDQHRTENAWLLADQDDSITVLQDDLTPWIYSRSKSTTIPSSWNPTVVKLESVKDADFEAYCRKMSFVDEEAQERSIRGPGPSHRALISHAAWKKGLSKYCHSIASPDWKEKTIPEYSQEVFDDLAWLHFLRGVNLLMYADREEAIRHLRLVGKLSPKGTHASDAKDLADRLEKFIADKKAKGSAKVEEEKLNDQERADYFVSQLVDLRCPQMSQPGFIEPYMALIDGAPSENIPTVKLREMGMAAVPSLLKALEDDTPTRTVYHWRDFAQNRIVWRVSDFAWSILRDISRKELGYRRIVGFTLGSMKPDEKLQAIKEANDWYAANKKLSQDDRMLSLFGSRNSEDWITAGKYFVKKKDLRAVEPLLKKIPTAEAFEQGDLCEVVAGFGDPKAKPVIQEVMRSATEHSARLDAAIALWTLGDNSGIPVAIEYVKAKEQPYGMWQEPIWFLIRSKTPEGLAALRSVINDSPKERVTEVIEAINCSITGDL